MASLLVSPSTTMCLESFYVLWSRFIYTLYISFWIRNIMSRGVNEFRPAVLHGVSVCRTKVVFVILGT
jgi:hypothetical protein